MKIFTGIMLLSLALSPVLIRAEGDTTTLEVKAMLGGAYDEASGLMNDTLRTSGFIPASEPYTALGYEFTQIENKTISEGVLSVEGPDAIVDWVVVELRDRVQKKNILFSTAALIQRDGDVVDVDGMSKISVPLKTGKYFVGILHRNHLGAMIETPIEIENPANFMLRKLFGSNKTPAKFVDGIQVLWPGDANFDGVVRYVGLNNDTETVFETIGGVLPTNVVNGYFGADINMDGEVKFTGTNNDRDIILQTLGGTTPTSVRRSQLPN